MRRLSRLQIAVAVAVIAVPTAPLSAEPRKELSGGEARAVSVAASDFRLTGRKAECFTVYVARSNYGYTVNFVSNEASVEFIENVTEIDSPRYSTRPANCPFEGRRYELSDSGRIIRRLPPPR